MELQAVHEKILAYLQRHGSINTFRLSRHLEIDRGKLIDIIKDLTNEELAKFEHGSVSINEIKYQKFIENKESLNIPKPVSKPKAKKPKFKIQENKWAKKQQQREILKKISGVHKDKLYEQLKKEIEELQAKKADIAQQLAEEIRLLNSIRKEKTEIGDIAAKAAEKERFLKQKKENKEIKPRRKRAIKKAKLKKGKKKSKEARAKRLGKEKQEKLESWIRQAKLEIERLKVEIELASMSHNASKIRSLEASAAKLRNMIDWRMGEK